MISRRCLLTAMGMLVVCPEHALSIGQASVSPQAVDLPRGLILPFYRRGLIVDGLPVMYVEERIWSGQEWLPIWSEGGELLVDTIRREIRDGTFDAE